MAYRTFDPTIVATERAEPRRDDLGCFRGVLFAIIPALLGWLMIFGMFYVAWGLLPQ